MHVPPTFSIVIICIEEVSDIFVNTIIVYLFAIIVTLQTIFQHNPDAILPIMDRIIGMMDDMDESSKTYLYMMLGDVAKKNPEVGRMQWHKGHHDIMAPCLVVCLYSCSIRNARTP